MKSDSEFVAALDKSKSAVQHVGQWMSDQGWSVVSNFSALRPDFESRHDYADSGDLEVRQRVEVKWINRFFTCAEDFPFPAIIVDEKFKIDRIPIKHLYGYAVVNREWSHVCLISAKTRANWKTATRYDSKDRQERTFYECPVEHCLFLPC